MKTETKEVKLTKDGRKQTVGTVELKVYENIDELLAAVEGPVIVSKFNKANKIDVMNAERGKHMERKLGVAKKIQNGYNVCTVEELTQFAGDYDALKEFLLSEEIQARVEAA
jgi:hypothetical protein